MVLPCRAPFRAAEWSHQYVTALPGLGSGYQWQGEGRSWSDGFWDSGSALRALQGIPLRELAKVAGNRVARARRRMALVLCVVA